MNIGQLFMTKILWVFIMLMVCAGSSEIAMAQRASAFAESSLIDKKDIMPTNGCAKPFVGINLAKKDCTPVDIFDTKMESNSPKKY